MLKRAIIALLSLLAASCSTRAVYAACAAGYIQITDPFLNPNGVPWTGSITYNLAYATTVNGATVVNSRQQFNVTSGISLCLAPGLYTPVTLNQNGSPQITQAWGVPVSGGPYTIAQIQGNITLMGSFGAVTLTGTPSAGQIPVATSATAATWQTSGAILSSKVTLLNSDVLALNSTPITLVPAPGAGLYIVVMFCVTSQNGNPAYTSSGPAAFQIGNNVVEDESIFYSSGDASLYFQFAPVVVTGDGSTFVNQPFTVRGTSAVTGSGGGMTITTYYQVVAIP